MGKRRFSAWLLLGVLTFLAGADRALAQGQTGVVTGTVTDGDGVIPGATVTAVDADTSVTRTATSNEQGVFRLLSMPSGRYTIRVEIEGFKQITIPDVAIYTGETRDLGKLALQVGVRSETVTITGGSHARADRQQRPVAQHHGGHAGVGPGEGPRRLRHDEDPAGRHRLAPQPRLRAVELGPLPEHQRRQLAQQEHHD